MTNDREVDGLDEKRVYDAFNVLWTKVPRHVRLEKENQARMQIVRAYFDRKLAEAAERREAERRASIVDAALKDKPESEQPAEGEEEPVASPLHQAVRVCRTLSRVEWEQTKTIVELHKFTPEDLLEVMSELQDTHCPDCGEWLDDEDEHADCPARDEEAFVEVAAESPTEAAIPAQTSAAAPQEGTS